ncbi:unnamed protein product [Lampetra planeri]
MEVAPVVCGACRPRAASDVWHRRARRYSGQRASALRRRRDDECTVVSTAAAFPTRGRRGQWANWSGRGRETGTVRKLGGAERGRRWHGTSDAKRDAKHPTGSSIPRCTRPDEGESITGNVPSKQILRSALQSKHAALTSLLLLLPAGTAAP